MKYTCNDSDKKIRYVIFNEELLLCEKHYLDLQKIILKNTCDSRIFSGDLS